MVTEHTVQFSKDEVKCAICSRRLSVVLTRQDDGSYSGHTDCLQTVYEVEAMLPVSIIHGDAVYEPTKIQVCEHCYNKLKEKLDEKLILSSRVVKSEKS